MADNSGPEEAAKGVFEDVKGKAKEAAGNVLGKDDLQQEGQAQQDKADEQRSAAKEEAKAEASRHKADVHEERQESFQDGR